MPELSHGTPNRKYSTIPIMLTFSIQRPCQDLTLGDGLQVLKLFLHHLSFLRYGLLQQPVQRALEIEKPKDTNCWSILLMLILIVIADCWHSLQSLFNH